MQMLAWNTRLSCGHIFHKTWSDLSVLSLFIIINYCLRTSLKAKVIFIDHRFHIQIKPMELILLLWSQWPNPLNRILSIWIPTPWYRTLPWLSLGLVYLKVIFHLNLTPLWFLEWIILIWIIWSGLLPLNSLTPLLILHILWLILWLSNQLLQLYTISIPHIHCLDSHFSILNQRWGLLDWW